MVAIFLDLLGGWVSAKYIRNLVLAMFTALVFGVIASVTGAYLIYLLGGDTFTEREIAARAAAGLIWHPLITVIATLFLSAETSKEKAGCSTRAARRSK